MFAQQKLWHSAAARQHGGVPGSLAYDGPDPIVHPRSVDLEQLDIEDEVGVGRDGPARAPSPVA